MYETSEAGIFHALRIIDQFKKAYEGLVIVDYLDDWKDILLAASDARDAITAGRSREGAVATATVYTEHFNKLQAICRKIDISRSTMNAAARRETRLFWWRAGAPAAVVCSDLIVVAAAVFKEETRCWLIG